MSDDARPAGAGLLGVTRVEVPSRVVRETVAHLQTVGRRGYEGITLWVGEREGEVFVVRANVVPAQTGRRTPEGVSVRVDADELHRINVWLHQSGMRLIAQVHSHPGEAYHSDTDDDFAIAAAAGSLSLVVPYFGFRRFAIPDCAVYRLLPGEGWAFVSPADAERLITIRDDGVDARDGSGTDAGRGTTAPAAANAGGGVGAGEAEKEEAPWRSRTSWIRRLWPRRTS